MAESKRTDQSGDREDSNERNLGEQPMAGLMKEKGLERHDLVVASEENITHKMVARGCKGRRLTKNVQAKLIRAMNNATGESFSKGDLFNY